MGQLEQLSERDRILVAAFLYPETGQYQTQGDLLTTTLESESYLPDSGLVTGLFRTSFLLSITLE